MRDEDSNCSAINFHCHGVECVFYPHHRAHYYANHHDHFGRGCAKAEECYVSGSSPPVYSGNALTANGQNPGGITILPTCCLANSFPDDDTLAIDYKMICNAAGASARAVSVRMMMMTMTLAISIAAALNVFFVSAQR